MNAQFYFRFASYVLSPFYSSSARFHRSNDTETENGMCCATATFNLSAYTSLKFEFNDDK